MFKTTGRHRKPQGARHRKPRHHLASGAVMQAAAILVFLPYLLGGHGR
jgi:hypothetical protein